MKVLLYSLSVAVSLSHLFSPKVALPFMPLIGIHDYIFYFNITLLKVFKCYFHMTTYGNHIFQNNDQENCFRPGSNRGPCACEAHVIQKPDML